ncbi:MAG TPA: sensor histidine kinase, partial [Cyclobacteriaceae bacterium]|nr:sensor histidine kinase [Cyclobacteriaceae bacterium]
GMVHNNLADIYTQLSKYDSALVNIKRALEIRKSINDYQGIVSSLNSLGQLEMRLNHFDNAERFLLQARDSANAKKLVVEQKKIYYSLYELYREKGNTVKALDNYVKFTAVKDSLLNESSHKQITELQVQYETEKKEQQIALQHSQLGESQARLQVTYIVIALLAVSVVAAIVIYVLARSRHRRTHALLLKDKELSVREAFIQASIASQENERKRFAQDLHDGMGQLISSLKLLLRRPDKLTTTEDRVNMMNEAEGLLDDMHREIRSIAFNLMPQTLIEYGLAPALKEMADRLTSSGRIIIRVEAFDLPERLSELQEVSLYRIIQEWINNVIKYAHATVIEVQLVGHEEEISLTVQDNGNGFDPSVLENTSGNGWKNVRSRSNLIKGSLDLDSREGRAGTTLLLTIPLMKSESPFAEKNVAPIRP